MSTLAVALTGNPNTGKSTIFNELTGARQKIGNWPGVTVDKKVGYTRYKDRAISIVDLPGTYSINARSPDEGISGTNTKKRDGFNQMIEDALAGKIDLIITKSVSRFARNTVDSLQNVRKLKENGVEIYFEKENIWTFDTRGELLITIMSSLAQEESRSISENTTWGKRKQFAEGKTSVGYSAFLGYDKDFKINEEQAQVVKLIYKLFLGGRPSMRLPRNWRSAASNPHRERTSGTFPQCAPSLQTRSTVAMH